MEEIYKLLIITETDDGEIGYKDFYCDVSQINGFWIPDLEEDEEPSINILVNGKILGILQEEHIKDYLFKRFGKSYVKL